MASATEDPLGQSEGGQETEHWSLPRGDCGPDQKLGRGVLADEEDRSEKLRA